MNEIHNLEDQRKNPVHTPIGYMQIYTYGKGGWPGTTNINKRQKQALEYAEFVGKVQGISLGDRHLWGFAGHKLLYHCRPFFFEDVICQYSVVKDKKASPNIPEIILHMTGRSPAKINDLASKFGLPLEKVVSREPIIITSDFISQRG